MTQTHFPTLYFVFSAIDNLLYLSDLMPLYSHWHNSDALQHVGNS